VFTGIIGAIGTVESVGSRDEVDVLCVRATASYLAGLSIGASVAVDGVCLTVTHIEGELIQFDVVPETKLRTYLSSLGAGMQVNLERAAVLGQEIGGHLIAGHVDTLITISAIEKLGESSRYRFNLTPQCSAFIFEKGFVALNGASLTVAKKTEAHFEIALIPETLLRTTFGAKKVGDKIHLEIDRATQAVVEITRELLEGAQKTDWDIRPIRYILVWICGLLPTVLLFSFLNVEQSFLKALIVSASIAVASGVYSLAKNVLETE